MTRLVIFCLFLGGLTLVMNLSSYNDVKIDNKRFDIKKAQEGHALHVKELKELAKMHLEATTPKVISDDVEIVEKTIIPLDTPQLVRPNKLYKQCISCHGKSGEGKKANKAPKIGGQMDWYVEKQLSDMKSKIRVNKNMATVVSKLSVEDIKDLSVFISKLPW